ncbi:MULTISPECIES: polysaccharide deacetylase family protein [unclassified Arthrobacter]|uniref:polysaccharide deacetylase family protein n=1 Tax=unclassified Arthrobacter TaxID=235627 RepID=UPI001C862D0A|nr:polysaccharide deacetylase family protein [Arthrobacter sp. MAHUQ-56]MBX7444939.1 polysaccharide deacetylase family protein [Arthrobacter sp. MAHUQ-56]
MSLTAVVGAHQVKASWTYVDGLPGLNSHLDSWLLGILDAAATPSGGRYRPAMAVNASQSANPGLTVSAQPVQAAGTVIVVREKVSGTGADGTSAASSETIYADTVSGEVHRAAELLRPEALDALPARAAGVPAGIAGPAAQQPALSDVVLTPSGELHITAHRPAGGGRSDQEKATISAGDAEAMLSDMGRKMLGQLQAAESPAPATAAASPLRHVNCDLVPCAALTYDDGPDARTTPQLLAILKEKNVHATFFMTGSNAASNPAIARQVAEAGHAIGNHTFSHPYLTKLSAAGVRSEMDRTDAAIRAAVGSAPSFMRPPYGAADAAVQRAVGKPLILWAVDSLDWQSKNPAVFVPKVLKEITPGAVVLMHDVDPTTIAGQQELITNLQTQGYTLVTVPQIFEGTPLVAGHVYRSRPERR